MESRTVKLVKPSPNILIAASDAEVYYVPELSLGCKDLENLLKVSSALLIHSTAHARATNIVHDLEYTSFNICR
jgi:hypothetical protein